MSWIEVWTGSPLAAALGWVVLHSVWQGAALAALLATVLGVLRSSPARYAACCAGMIATAVASAATLFLMLPAPVQSHSAPTPGAFPPWNIRVEEAFSAAGGAGLSALAPWIAAGWVAGALIVFVWQAAGWISLRRLTRRGICCADEDWQRRVAVLAERLRISRPVRVFESCLVDVPVVARHLRPVILIPAGLLAGLPPVQLEAILLHELAHVRRFDYLANTLQRIVEGIFFYHPAVWWMSRMVRRERENCCDDIVVDMSGDAHGYVCALAALEQARSPEPALAATGGSLMYRVRRLLYPQRPASAWTPLFAVLLLIATAAMALAWQAVPPRPTGETYDNADPYLAWLNSDVVYIIGDDERLAFLRLKTSEERDQFIEQFWLRRDPAPNTPENEFKTEHYRRIAWVNDRFTTRSGLAGWKTDRGRMYIVYGPPDEIEVHFTGGRMPFPYEDWRYRHIEGIGEYVMITFIDRNRTGDYRIAPDPRR